MPITIFTDGSSRGNPGPGGWGAIVIEEDRVKELGGRKDPTTNNQMELMAAIESLKATPDQAEIKLYTDSSYLINGITKRIKGWKKNNWQTKTKEDVMNQDLWMELDKLLEWRQVEWEYVGGHVGVRGNERCDEIATGFADNKEVELYDGALSEYGIPEILNVSHDEVKQAVKKSSSARSKATAYSYVSMVKGVIKTHDTWAECEKRVKGVKGARFKKALNAEEQEQIISEYRKI